jgi:tetratricopeptide (TPR) repeat protein
MLLLVERVLPVLEQTADDEGLAKAWYVVGAVHWTHCRAASMEQVLERAHAHARRSGSVRELGFVLNALGRCILVGPTPVDLARERCAGLLEEAAGDRTQQAILSIWVAILEAMAGDFDHARLLCAQSRAVLEELGQKLRAVALQGYAATIELLAGDLVAAEGLFRSALDTLEPLGERPNVRSIAARLGDVLVQLDRPDEAEELIHLSRDSAPADDVLTHVRWRVAHANLLAHRGDHAGAERLSREAIAIVDRTDWPSMRGDVRMCLAATLAAAGRLEESRSTARSAAELYEAKGNLVSARRAQILAGIRTEAAAAGRAT